MSLLTIPEFILHDTLTKMIEFIREDYVLNSADTTKSYIHKLLDGAGFQRYDFFDQAIAVFCGPKDDPRFLSVELMFNRQRKGAPSIHITLPAEQQAAQGNGLGIDEGYIDNEFVTESVPDDEDTDPITVGTAGSATPIYTRRYQAVYNIVVTSDNVNEVILIFHVVKALLTATIPHLHYNNLQNISMGGQDIQPYNDLAMNLYMRAVTVSLQYDTSVPSKYELIIPKDIIVDGKPSDEF